MQSIRGRSVLKESRGTEVSGVLEVCKTQTRIEQPLGTLSNPGLPLVRAWDLGSTSTGSGYVPYLEHHHLVFLFLPIAGATKQIYPTLLSYHTFRYLSISIKRNQQFSIADVRTR